LPVGESQSIPDDAVVLTDELKGRVTQSFEGRVRGGKILARERKCQERADQVMETIRCHENIYIQFGRCWIRDVGRHFKEKIMFVISGVTGHVGSTAARALLSKGQKVKVIVRDAKKGEAWSKAGAQVAVGDLSQEDFLIHEFKGAQGVFILLPPNWSWTDVFVGQKKLGATIAAAVKLSHVPHVVLLSSVGADLAAGTGPIKGLHHLENLLRDTGTKLTAVRPGFFMENIAQNIGAAKSAGIYPNMLPSQDMPMPMIATQDIGALVADALMAGPKNEVVDLHGPSYTVKQLAEKVGKALNKTLPIVDIPPAGWLDALLKGGVPKPWAEVYVEMYHGLLSGKVKPRGDRAVTGKTEIDTVIKTLA
jgi:uncharacterized protein YbjT (DUF2867 family)